MYSYIINFITVSYESDVHQFQNPIYFRNIYNLCTGYTTLIGLGQFTLNKQRINVYEQCKLFQARLYKHNLFNNFKFAWNYSEQLFMNDYIDDANPGNQV